MHKKVSLYRCNKNIYIKKGLYITGQLPAGLQIWARKKSTEAQPREKTKSLHCKYNQYSHSTCLYLVKVLRGQVATMHEIQSFVCISTISVYTFM